MSDTETRSVSRRAVLRVGVWSVPVVAVAVASPLAAASTTVDVGNFSLVGSCGVSPTPPGMVLVAGAGGIPVGTVITLSVTGPTDLGAITISGAGSASVTAPTPTTRTVTVTSPVPAGTELSMRTALSVTDDFNLTATVTLPTGYSPGAEAKPDGIVTSTDGTCMAE